MQIKEFIESGIIEMYCMELVSDEEKTLVEKMAAEHKEVRNEIAAVNAALKLYSIASEKSPSASLKDKILDAILNPAPIALPPRLSMNTAFEEWDKYIKENKIKTPAEYDEVFLLDLPGDHKQSTYIAWAKNGAVVEESHDAEDEFLFMLRGSCSVTINGVIGYYNAGDVVFIPKNAVHRAEVTSEEPMILMGQRLAA